tara:strand:+ start:56915 stop:58615 length:1701 start_codon:yes stop_codon:yes gene_type:complete
MKRHIETIRFPNFRRFRPNTKVDFDFPITIILGRNGTNKSSLLQALYGCPSGNSVGELWFETKLDAIPLEVNGLKQSLVYSYRGSDNKLVHCFKARAPRLGKAGEGKTDPDYFEAAKPSAKYGLQSGTARTPPLQIPVEYIDFRGQLPAFDKYFHFPDEQHLDQLIKKEKKRRNLRREYRKQDYLRRRTSRIINSLRSEGEALSKEELGILSYMLERDYKQGTIVEHSHYRGHRGSTIVFGAEHQDDYSDAFAGSGESAAALLIRRILKAKNGALILLDEPETSLHPRAQQRLLQFLADQATKKRLQIVISSHSIYLAEGLPQEAIKVSIRHSDGLVDVSSNMLPEEALHEIATVEPGKTVLVEDERAATVVRSMLQKLSKHAADEMKVIARRGGTSRLYGDLLSYSYGQQNRVIVLMDGDHKPVSPFPKELPHTEAGLDLLIEEQTRGNNEGAPKKTLEFPDGVKGKERFLKLFADRVFFLPAPTPEDLVWSTAVAAELTKMSQESLNTELATLTGKKRVEKVAELAHGLTCDAVFSYLCTSFILDSQASGHVDTLQLLEKIRCQ